MVEVKVKGMHCPSCEMLVKDELEEAGGKNIVVDHKKGIVKVENVEEKKVKEIIKNEGYEVLGN